MAEVVDATLVTTKHETTLMKIPSFIFGAAFLLASVMAQASPISCDDLTTMANTLDDVADAFAESGHMIEEGDFIDVTLADLTTALIEIADAEGDVELSRNVNAMASAWEDADIDGFQAALDNVIAAMDRLNERDC
jgi:hypothetical protein